MGRLFGTDGARGIANTEITCELAVKVGRATAMVLVKASENRPRVLIGADTRKSSDMLTSAMAAGLCSVGAEVLMLGTVPTPAVALLVKEYKYDAGIMISASHNPCEYNGIKIFKSDGYKLPDSVEDEIESIILDDVKLPPVKIGGEVGNILQSRNAIDDYIEHITSTAKGDFTGIKIAIDCANGSAAVTARDLFSRFPLECTLFNDRPNGININDKCGSTNIEFIQEEVCKNGFDLGIAFDGDADRILAVDHQGNIVDGDKIIAICAKFLKSENRLNKNSLAVTVMSNMGFFEFCKKNGIVCEQTKVGDRYVLENMVKNGYNLGGEQSGHIIFHDYASTGDGQLSAIQLLNCMAATGKSLKELADEMEVFPQVLINVRVSALGKLRLESDEEIRTAINFAQKELGSKGRVLVRASGTEPLVRVMLEGKDEKQIKQLSDSIAEIVRERLI